MSSEFSYDGQAIKTVSFRSGRKALSVSGSLFATKPYADGRSASVGYIGGVGACRSEAGQKEATSRGRPGSVGRRRRRQAQEVRPYFLLSRMICAGSMYPDIRLDASSFVGSEAEACWSWPQRPSAVRRKSLHCLLREVTQERFGCSDG
jgi:hypothetical protein